MLKQIFFRGDIMNGCLNCTERKLFCHDKCEKYAKFKYERQLIQQKHREFLVGGGYDGCLASKRRKYFSI